MITGFHSIIYSDDAEATRAFFRDVLDWPHGRRRRGLVDLQDATRRRLGVHPAVERAAASDGRAIPHCQLSLMCDDLEATIADLQGEGRRGREGPIEDQGFGLVTETQVPGRRLDDAVPTAATPWPTKSTAPDRPESLSSPSRFPVSEPKTHVAPNNLVAKTPSQKPPST